MEKIDSLFPNFSDEEKSLVSEAYSIAEKALEGELRGNGVPFIDHPIKVAKIACDEIGLGADCVCAVFLHEASRFNPEVDITGSGRFGKDILKMVYQALSEKGYNPVNQIVGYIMSGDPTYITSHNNARSLIMKVERDELVEEVLKTYIENNLWD